MKGKKLSYQADNIVLSLYRPFVEKFLYYDKIIVHRTYQQTLIFPIRKPANNLAIGISGNPHAKPFQVLAVNTVPCLDLLEKTQFLPLWIYADNGEKQDNITNWALEQFQTYYAQSKIMIFDSITKQAIFYYVYAVLHDPRYKEKFALNLKAEFPRIPLHSDFSAWATIGEKLLKLHVNFNEANPYPLKCVELKHKGAIKCKLKADKQQQLIDIDSVTQLCDIPAQAWAYQLGNRSALEWVLDQYKEKTPKDLTIREQFNHYRFADYKEQVIELLMKVCTVSIETVALIEQIKLL